MIPGHTFCGIRPVNWSPQVPQQFMFPDKLIGILTGEPWKHQVEEGVAFLARAAVFKPILKNEEDQEPTSSSQNPQSYTNPVSSEEIPQ